VTGFSNLERMRLLPLEDLKVDRWFVARVEHSWRPAAPSASWLAARRSSAQSRWATG
jgi:predicted signal transduction protein with EAL and GGDEF domain